MSWKNGRGKLGIFAPLIGKWRSESESPRGNVICTREFTRVLDDAYIQLMARWEVDKGIYIDQTFFGKDANKTLCFWSFTTDGKQSTGQLADVSDIHTQAFGFEAQMPAGLARQAYWPDEADGFYWAVESRNKKGWNRFVEQHYTRV